MTIRLPARITRVAIGVFVAALAAATPTRADVATFPVFEQAARAKERADWLAERRGTRDVQRTRQSRQRPEANARRQYQPQQRQRQRRPAQPALPHSDLALAGIPIIGSIMSMMGLHERRDRGAIQAKIGVDPARIPWCGFFVGWAVKQAGRTPPPSHGWAPNWARYGTAVSLSDARPGDIIVQRGHVGVFHSWRNGRVCMAGGNQSNAVTVACVSPRSVVAVRR